MGKIYSITEIKRTLLLSLSFLVALTGLTVGFLLWPRSPPSDSIAPVEPRASKSAPTPTIAIPEREQIGTRRQVAAASESAAVNGAARSTPSIVEKGPTGDRGTAKPLRLGAGEVLSSLRAEELMARLWEVDPNLGLTPKDFDEIASIVRALGGEGAAAIPAIRDFLESGADLGFADLGDGDDTWQHDSLRLALFYVLRQIGGPDAETGLLAELQATANPAEISTLATYLDELAPQGYRVEIVETARDILEAAKNSEHREDAGRLFQVLQSYGNAGVLTDLNNREEWGHYSTVALAGLPDGEGIPALIDLVEKRDGSNSGANIFKDKDLFALQMLSQAAVENLDARQSLIEQVRSDHVPSGLWPRIASSLTGDDQFQLEKPDVEGFVASTPDAGSKTKPHPYNTHTIGKTIIYTKHQSAKLSKAEIDTRLDLIDQLISLSRDPAASQALKDARDVLTDK